MTLKIIINGKQYQLLQPLPNKITSFSLFFNSIIPVTVPSLQTKLWFNELIDKLDTDYVIFNNIFIKSSELNKLSI